MKRIWILFSLFCLLLPTSAQALSVSARSAVLMDSDSGRVLYEKDKDNPRLIASITKIMTGILAIESGKLKDTVTVGEEVLKMYGSNIYIEVGEKMSLEDLVYGLLLRSGNDAAVVIATYVGESEENFVKMMNQKAKEIGMLNTVFMNAHGLDEETQNKSTAYDMALLSSYAYQNEIYRKIVSTKKYKVSSENKTYIWNNRNKLLDSYEYATGGKTGYTPSAGRTLVTNASKDKLNLTVVTLNDGNEYATHEELYEYGFANYKNYKIIDKDHFEVDKNFYQNQVYVKKSFSYPLLEEEKDDIRVLVRLNKQEVTRDGEEVGMIFVTLHDEEIFSEKIYGKIKKEKRTIFDWIRSWFS